MQYVIKDDICVVVYKDDVDMTITGHFSEFIEKYNNVMLTSQTKHLLEMLDDDDVGHSSS